VCYSEWDDEILCGLTLFCLGCESFLVHTLYSVYFRKNGIYLQFHIVHIFTGNLGMYHLQIRGDYCLQIHRYRR
jgi:hypothetical protein